MSAAAEAERAVMEARIRACCTAGEYRQATQLAIAGYGPELLQFVFTLMRETVAADEVFSRVCEDIWLGLPGLRWSGSFRGWAYAVARNACRRELRARNSRRWVALDENTEFAQLVESVRSATLPQLRSELRIGVAQLRASLRPDEQAILTLRIDRRLPWNEIAQIMADRPIPAAEITRAAAQCRKRFGRLTAKLRVMAQSAGLLPEDG